MIATLPAASESPTPVAETPTEAPAAAAVEESPNDPESLLSHRSVYYELDQSGIGEAYRPLLKAHAAYLASHPAARMRVEGNADQRGSREYNLALGQRRADELRSGLALLGAAREQIETMSWGEEKPQDSAPSEAAWAENRRLDIYYERLR